MCDLLSRRTFVGRAGLMSLGGAWAIAAAVRAAETTPTKFTADEVLQDLLDGNERFASGKTTSPRRSPKDFSAVAESQAPEALVIACSDSRVPPELLFDQGVGDLFVIRVAGNVISGSGAVVKGSIEFAIAALQTPLVVVLGHSGCGAVKTAVHYAENRDKLPPALDELVKLIKPAVERSRDENGDKLENAIRANVALGVEKFKAMDAAVTKPIVAGKVKVVGATYDLKTGRVKLIA